MSERDPRVTATLAALAEEPCRAGAPRLADQALAGYLELLAGWELRDQRLEKTFAFSGYAQTIGFVNALAWVAQRQDHHPDLQVGFNRCVVAWTTHDAGGVTRNDCIAAARTERLLA